jgi:hypothetical protein
MGLLGTRHLARILTALPNHPVERTAHSAGSVFAPSSVPVGRRSPGAFGFFLQTEGNLSRVNDLLYDARARRGDEVARCDAWRKSHMVRPVPDVRSLALSRDSRSETDRAFWSRGCTQPGSPHRRVGGHYIERPGCLTAVTTCSNFGDTTCSDQSLHVVTCL